MSLVEQELLFLPEYLSWSPVFSGVRIARSLVFCVVFCRSLFVLFFFLSLYFVCTLIYDFWLPLWYLRFTTSDYPFDILDLRLLITPLISSNVSYPIDGVNCIHNSISNWLVVCCLTSIMQFFSHIDDVSKFANTSTMSDWEESSFNILGDDTWPTSFLCPYINLCSRVSETDMKLIASWPERVI